MRNLESTHPSPTELNDFDFCPTFWFFRWRERVRKIESPIRFISGSAISDALAQFYLPDPNKPEPLALYDALIEKAWLENTSVSESEWISYVHQDREVLALFVNTQQRMLEDWEEIVSVQGRLGGEVSLVPDMIVKLKDGTYQPQEWKTLSAWADIEHEKQKYELGWQPRLYVRQVEKEYGKPCTSCRMVFLKKGKQPYIGGGRTYKAEPPEIDSHIVWVEDWKKLQLEVKLKYTRACMLAVEQLVREGTTIDFIPSNTLNCKKLIGKKVYDCDYYVACSANMHPVQMEDIFERR